VNIGPGQMQQQQQQQTIDPRIVARAAVWSEHKMVGECSNGQSYFYNSKLAKCVGKKPKAMKDLESKLKNRLVSVNYLIKFRFKHKIGK